MSEQQTSHSLRLFALWALVGLLLVALAGILAWTSPRFGYDVLVRDMPVLQLSGGLIFAGLVFLVLTWLIPATLRKSGPKPTGLLVLVVMVGLAMRLALLTSEPALEDDYQRYLWDGGMTAHGMNPYATSPADAAKADPDMTTIGALARDSGLLIGRVNHPELRTLYPPVTQAVFALSHMIKPWSLIAWRAVLLAFDAATAALLFAILLALGRSPLWAALYWWNPVAVKELVNSAHMEAIVAALIVGALFLAIRKRPVWATVALSLAAGAKIWPIIFLPLVWRPLLSEPRRLMAAIIVTGLIGSACAYPLITAGLDQSSGLVAYANEWRTNNALMPRLEDAVSWLLNTIGITAVSAPLATRGLLATVLALVILVLSWRPHRDADDLVVRWTIVAATMFLVSPAQFPWYFLWVLPFLALTPVFGLLLATATLPLYYSAFHFMSRDSLPTYSDGLVWLVWIPVWVALAIEFWPRNRSDSQSEAKTAQWS